MEADAAGDQPSTQGRRSRGAAAQKALKTRRRGTSNVCQVVGCGADLLQCDKQYCARLKICPSCIQAPSMPDEGGESARFCFQCAKLHPLTAFEGMKRSCRASLSKRNAHQTSKQTTQRSKSRSATAATAGAAVAAVAGDAGWSVPDAGMTSSSDAQQASWLHPELMGEGSECVSAWLDGMHQQQQQQPLDTDVDSWLRRCLADAGDTGTIDQQGGLGLTALLDHMPDSAAAAAAMLGRDQQQQGTPTRAESAFMHDPGSSTSLLRPEQQQQQQQQQQQGAVGVGALVHDTAWPGAAAAAAASLGSPAAVPAAVMPAALSPPDAGLSFSCHSYGALPAAVAAAMMTGNGSHAPAAPAASAAGAAGAVSEVVPAEAPELADLLTMFADPSWTSSTTSVPALTTQQHQQQQQQLLQAQAGQQGRLPESCLLQQLQKLQSRKQQLKQQRKQRILQHEHDMGLLSLEQQQVQMQWLECLNASSDAEAACMPGQQQLLTQPQVVTQPQVLAQQMLTQPQVASLPQVVTQPHVPPQQLTLAQQWLLTQPQMPPQPQMLTQQHLPPQRQMLIQQQLLMQQLNAADVFSRRSSSNFTQQQLQQMLGQDQQQQMWMWMQAQQLLEMEPASTMLGYVQ